MTTKKGTKYNNRKTIVDGITFDSIKESKRYGMLKLMESSGEIIDLKLQVKFEFKIDGKKMFSYISDFTYFNRSTMKLVVEDVKGFKTPLYKLKKKLIEQQHQIKIIEI